MHSRKLSTEAFISKTDKTKKTAQNLPAFDMSLIGLLESDHEQILDLFNKVLMFAKNKEYTKVKFSLLEFTKSVTDHINVEDDHLYGYFENPCEQ